MIHPSGRGSGGGSAWSFARIEELVVDCGGTLLVSSSSSSSTSSSSLMPLGSSCSSESSSDSIFNAIASDSGDSISMVKIASKNFAIGALVVSTLWIGVERRRS